MKIDLTIQQGSEAWETARLGIPTASQFHRVVTPVKCELSAQRKDYALKLVAERLLRVPVKSDASTEFMEHGKEFEPWAVKTYETENGVTTVPVGFITTDDGRLGCSPDRLVTGDKSAPKLGLEVKCPSFWVHLKHHIYGPGDNYKPQVMGQIYVGEFDRIDFYSYHPQSERPLTLGTYRDEPYIKTLSAALRDFADELDALTEKARALGIHQAVPDSELSQMQQQVERDADRLFNHGVGA